MEPVANLCSSGVLDRFEQLRFATIEAGIGWVPWALEAMDEAYRKHHMWVFPKLKMLPSEYFRQRGFASFQEDRSGLALAEQAGLADNFMWANDYPPPRRFVAPFRRGDRAPDGLISAKHHEPTSLA